MKKHGKLFVISAPSGAGKTTLVKVLCDRIGQQCNIEHVVTYTSKQPRVGEQGSKDYHFCSKEAFEQKINEGFFIEWSTAYGHYYGSPRHILDELPHGRSFILVIDRAGARAVAEQCKNSVLIWVYTKNFEILEDRLRSRNTENNSEIIKRLTIAKQEIMDERTNSFYLYHVLNDKFEIALQELESIIAKELAQSKNQG